MIIKRVLNNNTIISLDKNDEEIVVKGKGIAFGKKLVKRQMIKKQRKYLLSIIKKPFVNTKKLSWIFLKMSLKQLRKSSI